MQKPIRSSMESEGKARRTVAATVHENEKELDQTELIKLLEEEMIEAARNLEFERAAQLRDKLNEYKGAPTITSGGRLATHDGEAHADERKIWEPKSKGRGKKPRAAK